MQEKGNIQRGATSEPRLSEPLLGGKEKTNYKIYFALMFLDAAVLWAYYSVLAAQEYYQEKFPGVNFQYYITFVSSWPVWIGHTLSVVFGVDKKLGFTPRIISGYSIVIVMSVVIMLQEVFKISVTGHAAIILVCVGIIGASNSVTEAPLYGLAGLFNQDSYTQAMQTGNGSSSIINMVVLVIIRLAVGGVNNTKDTASEVFYLFFGVLITISVIAIFLYLWLIRYPPVAERMIMNKEATMMARLDKETPCQRITALVKITRKIWVAAFTQFFVFFVSLAVFPGIPCSAKLTSTFAEYPTWFCSPAIIGLYAVGDFSGRLVSVGPVMRVLTINRCAVLSILRLLFVPLVLFSVDPYYIQNEWAEVGWMLAVGLSNGILSTVTMAKAPLLLDETQRESAAYIMVFCLYFGLAVGSTAGFLIGLALPS